VIDLAKLRDYCLSTVHPRGRHKARVFFSALGVSAEHADMLRDALLEGVRTADATLGSMDEHGQRFQVEFTIQGPTGQALIRSAWIIRAGEDFPRFLTCFV